MTVMTLEQHATAKPVPRKRRRILQEPANLVGAAPDWAPKVPVRTFCAFRALRTEVQRLYSADALGRLHEPYWLEQAGVDGPVDDTVDVLLLILSGYRPSSAHCIPRIPSFVIPAFEAWRAGDGPSMTEDVRPLIRRWAAQMAAGGRAYKLGLWQIPSFDDVVYNSAECNMSSHELVRLWCAHFKHRLMCLFYHTFDDQFSMWLHENGHH